MASTSSKYYWPLLGQEPMVSTIEGGPLPSTFSPLSIKKELMSPLHLAPGVRVHEFQNIKGSIMAPNTEGGYEMKEYLSSCSVSFLPSPDLLLVNEMTFVIYFGADYPGACFWFVVLT